jgi:hypothetical protein
MQQPSSAVARWRLKIRLLTMSIRCVMIDTLYHLRWLFRLFASIHKINGYLIIYTFFPESGKILNKVKVMMSAQLFQTLPPF